MAVLAKYHGIDLPVFDEDTTVAWSHDEIATAAITETSDTFVRRTAITYVPRKGWGEQVPLSVILNRAEEGMAHLCEHVGMSAKVVAHEWGLFKGFPDSKLLSQYNSGIHPSIPRGYSLVAKVERVAGATAILHTTVSGQAILKAINEYENQLQLTQYARTISFPPFAYFDMGLSQFVSDEHGTPVLVDIDPRIEET